MRTSRRGKGLCRFDESKNLVAAAYYENDAQRTRAQSDTVRPAALENEKVEAIIAKYEGKPGALIHVLMEVQSENHWLPKEILNAISERLDVPLSRVMQIASFYKTFSLTPKGRHRIHVCSGTSCHLRGADALLDSVRGVGGGQGRGSGRGCQIQPGDRLLPWQLHAGAGDHRGWRTPWQAFC